MNARERLHATLNRNTLPDRPPVSFYELDRVPFLQDFNDPYCVYSDNSWNKLLDIVKNKVDLIVSWTPVFKNSRPHPRDDFTKVQEWEKDGSKFVKKEILHAGKSLTSCIRRDIDIDTWWTIEHLCKSPEDLETYLTLPYDIGEKEVDKDSFLELDRKVGDRGITYINIPDPLCMLASLFEMAEFTILAMTEKDLVHKALEIFSYELMTKVEAVSKTLPGYLWRIFGPEYASEPYLPPSLFEEYVVKYDKPIIRKIKEHGGIVRIHSHGRLKNILDLIIKTGCDGLDPIEPPPQGDVELRFVREKYGKDLILFGNLEASDIENLPPEKFKLKVEQALNEGMEGQGKGFVLMPSASPYGRKLPETALKNYEIIIECVEKL